MPSKINRYASHIRVLCKAKPSLCKAMLNAAEPELIQCLCECALNVLKGNVSLHPGQKRKLMPYKEDLRFLASRSGALQKKKRVLQKGGLLPAVLGPIIGLIASSL